MTNEEIKEVIIDKILIPDFGLFKTDIDEEKTLEDLGMDSLDTLEFINFLEKKFSIDLDAYEILTTTALHNIVETISHIKN